MCSQTKRRPNLRAIDANCPDTHKLNCPTTKGDPFCARRERERREREEREREREREREK